MTLHKNVHVYNLYKDRTMVLKSCEMSGIRDTV